MCRCACPCSFSAYVHIQHTLVWCQRRLRRYEISTDSCEPRWLCTTKTNINDGSHLKLSKCVATSIRSQYEKPSDFTYRAPNAKFKPEMHYYHLDNPWNFEDFSPLQSLWISKSKIPSLSALRCTFSPFSGEYARIGYDIGTSEQILVLEKSVFRHKTPPDAPWGQFNCSAAADMEILLRFLQKYMFLDVLVAISVGILKSN